MSDTRTDGARVLLATRSAGKLRELLPMLRSLNAELLTLDQAGIAESDAELSLECYDTFEENALAKARHFSRISGMLTLADDSGLEVNALGGRPGVHSKRWSGRHDLQGEDLDAANRAKLLHELQHVQDRRARFVCAAACVGPRGELVVRGETTGTILHEPRGTHGFGYDPLFLSDDLGCTLAECAREEKERVSHRGRAFAALQQRLETH